MADDDATLPFARGAGRERPAGDKLGDDDRDDRGGGDSGEGDTTPRTFGRYEILGELGRGGMGVVYRARDPKLGRVVALKVLLAADSASREEAERFFREAEASAALRHPNIVSIHELDVHEGKQYFTMELVEGRSLAAVLKEEFAGKGRLVPRRAFGLVESIARGVHHAHSQGIIHRDIKPSNVLVAEDGRDGRPMVMDFGLAKSLKADSSLTQSGIFMGTPDYASPEQAEGRTKEVDARSDVFSLGVMLYEMLTGRLPFMGDGPIATLREVAEADPPALRRVEPRIPRDAEVITLKCLEKDPARRYQTAEALAEDARRFIDGDAILARPASLVYKARKRLAKHKAVATVSALALALVAALGGWRAYDWWRQFGRWELVYYVDFTDPNADLSGIEFLTGNLAAPVEPVIDEGGLSLPDGSWCWLRGVRAAGDVRLDLTVRWPPRNENLGICILSRREVLPNGWSVPPGYACRAHCGVGVRHQMARVEKAGFPWGKPTVSWPAESHEGSVRTLTMIREGMRVALLVDGGTVLEHTDYLPLRGEGLDGAGFRGWLAETRVLRASFRRLALAERPSPVVAGDALAREGELAAALRTYRTIAGDHPGDVAALALAKAYFVAREMGEAGKAAAGEVRSELERRYPGSRHWVGIYTCEAVAAWRAGDFPAALRLVREAARRGAPPEVVQKVLDARRARLDPGVARELFGLLRELGGQGEVDRLDLRGLGLADMSGLRGLRLRWLDVSGNDLADIAPLAGMPLGFLDCSANRVEDLAVAAGMPLRALDCTGNRIESLAPLTGLDALESLLCGRNRIESLEPLAGLAGLRSLDCKDNRIKSLEPLRGLTALSSLWCEGNRIESLEPLGGLTALTSLECNNNRIEGLEPIRGLTALSSLGCGGNRIVSLDPLRGLTALTQLYCSGNRIESLEPLGGLTALMWLSCQDNRIESLEPVKGLTALSSVKCSSNRIGSLGPLGGLTKLVHLWCSGNRIESLEPLRGLTALSDIKCGGNRIGSLEPVKGLTALTSLGCGSNRITSLEPVKGLTALTSLGCGSNRITSLEPLRGLTALTGLWCDNNRIESLEPIKGLTALSSLWCQGNQIESLEPVKGLTALSQLGCRGNQIESLEPVKGLTALRWLGCEGNRIESLEPVKGLTALTGLDCGGNRVTSLEPFVTGRKPPELLVFDCETLPEAELARAREVWSRDPSLAARVRDVDVILVLRRGDEGSLRGLAAEFEGHRYLHVPRALAWRDAEAFARELGGHLATLTSREENDFAASLKTFDPWIGLYTRERPAPDAGAASPEWVTGEPLDFARFASESSDPVAAWYYGTSGNWYPDADPANPRPFVVEWDDTPGGARDGAPGGGRDEQRNE